MDCLFLDRVLGFVFWFVCLLVVIGLVRADAPLPLFWLFLWLPEPRLWAVIFIFVFILLVLGCGIYFIWLLAWLCPDWGHLVLILSGGFCIGL